MEQYHPALKENGVSIDIMLAHGPTNDEGDKLGPAVKHHGRACKAKIRVIGLKDRAAGRADAELILDGDVCDTWGDEEAAAIIDHELTHLELSTFEDGTIKRDDLERPKLRIRLHDIEFGWFDSVARRHKKHATEVQQAIELLDDHTFRQLYLPGVDFGKYAEIDKPAKATKSKGVSSKRQAAMLS